MEDQIVKGFGMNKEWRAFACEATDLVRIGMAIHHLKPDQAAYLAKIILATCLLGAYHGAPRSMAIGIGDKENKCFITAQMNQLYEIKAIADFHAEISKDESASIGISVTEGSGQPHQTFLPVTFGHIEDGLSEYFEKSAQILTRTRLHVNFDKDGNVTRAFGYLIQAMPGASEETKATMLDRFDTMLSGDALEFREVTMDKILSLLLKGDLEEEIERFPLVYGCNCSKEASEELLASLGMAEMESILKDGHDVRVDCPFCRKSYYFTLDDIRKILKNLKKVNQA